MPPSMPHSRRRLPSTSTRRRRIVAAMNRLEMGHRVVLAELAETPLEGIEKLQLLEQEPPDPASLQPNDVIVRVRAAAVGWVDLIMTSGQYQHVPKPPYTPGLESAGEVAWVGPDVSGLAVGDPVLIDGFLAGLPAGVQLFSLFEANPHLIDLLVDIVGTSAELAGYLSRNSGVFDAVIGGDFFSGWPGRAALLAEIETLLAAEPDYETQLDASRRWAKEWLFRIGVHHLRGLIDAVMAASQYADLADAVISALAPAVAAQFARRHGPPPGRGAAVLGMGSLGAAQLTATSDLDIIVIYDPGDSEASEGRKPLPARQYYARLTQALITALTAPMSQGRLYEVDMRLRPSGTQGPVATSLASFANYQRNEAWVWEHLALTRARTIAGDASLCDDIETLRRSLLALPRDRAGVLGEVAQMRGRIAAAKAPSSVWDVKTGPGRLQDVELVAQAGALLASSPRRDVASGLGCAVAGGWLSEAEGETLRAAHALYWSVHTATRLISVGGIDDGAAIGEGGAAFLCRTTGYDDIAALRGALEAGYGETAAIIDAALAQEGAMDEG